MSNELRDLPYLEYLQSDHWRDVRRDAYRRAGGRCQVCGATRALECHHNNYAHLGNERPEDVIILCRDCHRLFHERRTLQGRANGR